MEIWFGIGCHSSAACLTDLLALSNRNVTPIQMLNFCCVKSNTCIMLLYWACINLDLPKNKKSLAILTPSAIWQESAVAR